VPVVSACVRGVEAEARARHVALDASVDPGVAATCEPAKVERVLLNLLTNALHHTPADGSIAVLVEPDDVEVRMTVEDTGTGLSTESTRRMFERFCRRDPARSSGSSLIKLIMGHALPVCEPRGARGSQEDLTSD
jgi:two-component system, OmpR family, phosphate regulon sensor histidine kinase PhoR